MAVELLDFRVPVENHKTLLVWNLQPDYTEIQIQEGLHEVFSSFGPLYLLKVCPNAAPRGPPAPPLGYYAIIKFYSGAQAAAAQRSTDGQRLYQRTPVKVRLSSKQTPHFLSASRPLSHAHCLQLANHCLGFNGWTSDIITLKELTNEEEEEEEEGGGARRRLRIGCLLQLNFPLHGRTTRASAVLDQTFTWTGPEALIQNRRGLHRLVKEKALVQAFSTVLLVLLADGKVMVELKLNSDQSLPEQPEDVLQVNEFSWKESAAADEDEDEDDDDEEETEAKDCGLELFCE